MLRDRVIFSVAIGVIAGTLLSIWVTAIRIVAGPGAFTGLGATYPLVVLTYLASGVAGGVIVGLLWPLTRWRVGLVFVGFFVGVATFAGIRTSIEGFQPWTKVDFLIVGVLGLALGPPLAFRFRSWFGN